MYYCIEFIFTTFGLFIGISLKLLGAKKELITFYLSWFQDDYRKIILTENYVVYVI